MKKHLLLNQLFGTEGSPNQTDETLTPREFAERTQNSSKPRRPREVQSLYSGCSAVDVPMTSYGAPDEHPMSIRSASDGTRWNSRVWKYVACILMLLVLSIGQMWGATVTMNSSLGTSTTPLTTSPYIYNNTTAGVVIYHGRAIDNNWTKTGSPSTAQTDYKPVLYNEVNSASNSSAKGIYNTTSSNPYAAKTQSGKYYTITFTNCTQVKVAGTGGGSESGKQLVFVIKEGSTVIDSTVVTSKKDLSNPETATSSTLSASKTYTLKICGTGTNDCYALEVAFYYPAGGGCTSITPTWATEYSSTTLNVGGISSTPSVGGNTGSGAVTFSSSDTYIATVNSSGVVTGVGAGTATITATVAASGDYCSGTVTQDFTIKAGVTYDANSATGGSVPTDDNTYAYNANITVAGNTGSLYKTGKVFNGWNTRSDGTGTHYEAGVTMKMPSKSTGVTLYAEWVGYATSWEWWNSGQGHESNDFTYVTNKNYTCTFSSANDKSKACWDITGSEAYRGIKLKISGAQMSFWVQTGKRVSITFGYTAATPTTFSVGGVDKKSDFTKAAGDSATYSYTTSADTKFVIKTSSDGAFCIKSVKIEDAAASCTAPTGLTNGDTGSTSQEISWTAPASAPEDGYLVAYSSATNTAPGTDVTATGGSYTVVAAAGTSTTLYSLSASTTYHWWVRSVCDESAGTRSAWVAGTDFTTSSCARQFATGDKIYFKDASTGMSALGNKLWKELGKNLYAYFWNGDDPGTWTVCTVNVDKDWNNADAIYEITVPEGGPYEKMFFSRGTEDGVNKKEKYTTDEQPCVGRNLFYISSDRYGDAFRGSWGSFTPSGKTIYFDNRNVTDWTTAYVRIGNSSSNSAWGSMTKVGGTRNLYSQASSQWASHTLFSIANNAGWTGNRSVDQPEVTYTDPYWSGDAHKMTKQTNYQDYAIENDIYILPTSTSVSQHECQFYKVNTSTSTSRFDSNNTAEELPAYTVTTSETHCTVTMVKYTADDFSTNESLASGGTVKPTQYIGVTVTPDAGYTFSSVSLSSGKYIEHTAAADGVTGKYAIMDDACVVTAVCTEATYNITYKDGGNVAFSGSHADGYPTTHTYGTSTTLKTASKDGYSFGGWYTKSDFSGSSKVESLGATAFTANITLYAQWTKDVYLEMGDGWDSGSPWFAIYFWKNGGTATGWAEMELADACSDPAVYKAPLPMDVYDRLIFVQMDPTKEDLAWESKKNYQTEDLTYPATNYKYTITDNDGGADSKSTGSWGTYSIPTYTISYNKGTNGTGTKESQSKTCDVDFTLPGSTFTYGGHTQDGWATSNGGTKAYELSGSYTTNAAQEFYPHWKCNTPSITDNGNNTVTITVPSGTTVRYTTDGTDPSSSSGTVYSTTFSIAADCTVKAIAYQTNCTDSEIASRACDYSAPATLYTVTFNTNGGSSQSSITQASEGASITMPSAPTKAGNTFVEWVIGSTTKAVGASYTPTANVTAYASWQTNCSDGATTTTTFNFNSGNATGLTIASNGSNASCSIVNAKTQNIPVLDGYFLASSFTSNSSGIITITTDASYTNIDSIKFNSASTDNSNPKIAIYGVKKDGTDSIQLKSNVAMSSGTTKTWRAAPYTVDIHGKSPKYSGKVRFKLTTGSSDKHAGLDNIVIYNAGGGGGTCYYVTYNGNGAATGFTADETAYGVSSGTTVTVKANGAGGAAYAKSGNIFSGWNTKSDGTGTSFKAGDTFTISKDTILYAQWADPSSGDCFYIDDAKKKSDYSVSVGGTFDDTKLKGSITGGTVTNTSTESVSFSGNSKYGIIFDASTKKITVRLSSGTLKSGATIKIGGYTNNSKSQTCGFKVSGNNCSPASVSTASGNSSYNFFTQTYTVSAADGVIGTDSFSITLVDDKTYLDSLYVSGCDDCTEGGLSYATASVTKTICDAAFTNTLSNSNSLTGITYSSTNTSVATVESDGEVTIVGAGTTTIKATAAAQSTYCASEATYSLTVNSGTAAGLSFATASYSKATDDEGFTQTVTNPNSLTGVTYSSSNPSVATVNETTGAVTLVSTGSTTITASTDAQTVSTTCYAAGSASYTISVSGSASCTTLPDYIWKTGSTYTPVGTSHTYADGDYNAIDNSASGTTHISISGTNYEQKSGSLNIGKSKDNYFLITAASGYVIDSVYFYAKMEDGECRMTTDNSSWDAYSAGQTTAKAFAIGVGTQYFGIKNKNTDSPKGVWIRTMRIKVCSASAKYTVTYNLNGHGDAIAATTNITPNTSISAPSAPSADCYTFGGWYKEAGCTNAWTFASDKVTNNMTLYAKWTSNKAQVASTDYGKLVYTVTPASTADALSVTPVDATGVTYKWLEYTSDDVSSASAIGGATSSSYSPSIASVGTKYYWAVLEHDCGNDTTDAFRIVVNAAKTDPTIVWGNVQLGGKDTDPTYGGGGYTLTGTINAGNASTPTLTTDMISAGEGVVITSKSVNDASKTFSLTFGLTAAFDTTQAKLTDIHFELPGNATYNDSLFATNLDYDKCSSGGTSTDVYVIGKSNSAGTGLSSASKRAFKVASNWRSTSSPTFTEKTSADGFTISADDANMYWAQSTQTIVASTSGATMKTLRIGSKAMTITWTTTSLSFSKVRIIGKNLGSAASTVSVSNGTTSSSFTFEKSSDMQIKEVSLDFTYGSEKGVRFTTKDAIGLDVLIELVPTGSDGAGTGTSTALEWKSGKAPSDITGWDGTAKKIVKAQADANFSVVAQQTSATNSLGAITYSSNNEEVATVNSTTGEVDIVAGASGGEATITATMARSGCYMRATKSYTINVPALACELKAGSIAATTSATISVSGSTVTKCSTEAVTLTISGHTTSGTTVTWWKDGVQVVDDDNIYNIEGATLATKAEGTYNAKVTGATCAIATNNIKVVNRSASVSVTKLVNQWYIKNGRVTPDIPLFELGEGCSFVGAKADDEDLSDELGGCTVYQKDGSNIVYLQGKAPSGMTVGNVSLQIVVEDVCGNTGTSAAITIHKQVATDKHELAFVVGGTNYAKKTFSEDAWTDGINASQSTGLALYQVLKDTFKILATNIYASDSIQQIREYYSQFDLICITDYPNTGTKGKHGRSYVDAIGGAMIDVRPLLTMEAYVSGLDNWRAKGVIGSRTTPSKRQYNMMLQCKDHEIFDGTTLKQFGYGDDALFQVNIVDSTAHRYTDLDATSKSTHASDTAALQGFTVGEMKDLLPLGTTDNGSGTDLQVGVERQKVMAARMMVLGINSYAMERLSKDGKQIVVNALQYLTKKRSEDISDCSSYFTNADGDNEWGNPLNWRSGTVPTSNQEARITQPVTISDTRKIASIKIATDGTFQDADVDGSIKITSTGTLIVTGKVQSVKSPDFMNGFATSAEDVTIKADDDSQGALILNNEDGTTMATVEMYSKAGYEDDGVTPNFAYVGAPVSGMTLGSAFSGAEVWYYNESNPYWWSRCDDSETSDAHFLTYCISHWEPQKFTLSGTLAPTGTQNFTLSVHSGGVEGDNMIANSWTAPIDIAQFEADDFDGAEATLYMYRTGHDEVRGTGEAGDGAGKWATVSVDAAKSYVWPAQLRMIPSMQAFCIEVSSTHTLTMDYDRLVRANAYTYENGEEHAAILAPKRRMAKANRVDPAEVEGLRLVVSGETTGYDVYLFAHPGFSENFDNGWDARHMEGGELSNPLLCVPSELGNLDIAAIPELAGRELKFVPSSEREYTFSMTYEGDNELYLNDIKLEKSTRIQTGNTYDFVWENGDGHNRFIISAAPFAPQTPTGVTNLDAQTPKAQKFIYKDKMFIIRGGKVFSADGQLVK